MITDQQLIDLLDQACVEEMEESNYHVRTDGGQEVAANRITYVGDGDSFYQVPIDLDALREGIERIIAEQISTKA